MKHDLFGPLPTAADRQISEWLSEGFAAVPFTFAGTLAHMGTIYLKLPVELAKQLVRQLYTKAP